MTSPAISRAASTALAVATSVEAQAPRGRTGCRYCRRCTRAEPQLAALGQARQVGQPKKVAEGEAHQRQQPAPGTPCAQQSLRGGPPQRPPGAVCGSAERGRQAARGAPVPLRRRLAQRCLRRRRVGSMQQSPQSPQQQQQQRRQQRHRHDELLCRRSKRAVRSEARSDDARRHLPSCSCRAASLEQLRTILGSFPIQVRTAPQKHQPAQVPMARRHRRRPLIDPRWRSS